METPTAELKQVLCKNKSAGHIIDSYEIEVAPEGVRNKVSIDKNDRYARLAKSPMEPLRQRTGLDPCKLNDTGPLRQLLDERAGFARNLTLPLHRAVAVDNADRSLGK